MTSPFKFLDAFERGDKAIFFGRSAEIEALYRLVFEANLVLVYGVSGTGKTSLIQCGLANRFAQTDWFQLFVRRTDDINAALDREIRARAQTPIPDDTSPVEAIRSLYLDYLRPVYLIFDQFEELLILGSREEQDRFFATVAAIIASDVSCKIIISLREEYLAAMHRFEEVVPSLFNKRLRVEPMSMRNVEEVITGTTSALDIRLEHSDDTAKLIMAQLDDPRVGVQLAYLQVYLDSLYNRAVEAGPPIVFTDAVVRETGKLGDIMAGFLTQQSAAIQARLTDRHPGMIKGAVSHLLEEFVTVDGTKQPTSREELVARLPETAVWIDDALAELQAARILRNVDGRFELAHDSLAARICEGRSGERRAMLIVQKDVRDGFERGRYLDAEDLARVNHSRRKKDPIRGTPLLELTADEEKFVRKSASRLRWRRSRFAIFNIVVLAVVMLSAGLFVFQILITDDEAVAATNDFDRLVYSLYDTLDTVEMADAKDQKWLDEARTSLVADGATMNTDRETALAILEDGDTFWMDLKQADLLVDSDDEQRQAAGRKNHLRLERDLDTELAADPTNLRARARLMAIQRRLYYTEPEGPSDLARLRKILSLATPASEYLPVDFEADIESACDALAESHKVTDERCPT